MRNASSKAIPDCSAPKQRERYLWRLIQKVTNQNFVERTVGTENHASYGQCGL